jgi:hypothetical protein
MQPKQREDRDLRQNGNAESDADLALRLHP